MYNAIIINPLTGAAEQAFKRRGVRFDIAYTNLDSRLKRVAHRQYRVNHDTPAITTMEELSEYQYACMRSDQTYGFDILVMNFTLKSDDSLELLGEVLEVLENRPRMIFMACTDKKYPLYRFDRYVQTIEDEYGYTLCGVKRNGFKLHYDRNDLVSIIRGFGYPQYDMNLFFVGYDKDKFVLSNPGMIRSRRITKGMAYNTFKENEVSCKDLLCLPERDEVYYLSPRRTGQYLRYLKQFREEQEEKEISYNPMIDYWDEPEDRHLWVLPDDDPIKGLHVPFDDKQKMNIIIVHDDSWKTAQHLKYKNVNQEGYRYLSIHEVYNFMGFHELYDEYHWYCKTPHSHQRLKRCYIVLLMECHGRILNHHAKKYLDKLGELMK